jgi:hypothetical protein
MGLGLSTPKARRFGVSRGESGEAVIAFGKGRSILGELTHKMRNDSNH